MTIDNEAWTTNSYSIVQCYRMMETMECTVLNNRKWTIDSGEL